MAGLLQLKVKVMVAVAMAVALIPLFGPLAIIGAGIGVLALQGINREIEGLNG